jgi:putative flippase GtrA
MPTKFHNETLPRFIVVGVTCAIVYFVLSLLFQLQLRFNPFFASIAAYGLAFGLAYVLQKTWTFRSSVDHRVSLPRYAVLQVGCALFTASVTQFLSFMGDVSPVYISFFATGLACLVSYILSSSWVFADRQSEVNSQYSIAHPQSLAVRVAAYQRRRMYSRFLEDTGVLAEHTILDVGATDDRTFVSSNYLEAWYPYKDKITAVGMDNASFLITMYPGMRFLRANGRCLPFADKSFDVVHSSAVLEHVGSFDDQARFIHECVRVARKVAFFTTPNRWFPIEFHTVLPFVHWLPKPWFRFLMRAVGLQFFAEESNLNLMSRNDLLRIAQGSPGLEFNVSSVSIAGWPSNLLITVSHTSSA